jgi:anti-sigma-K factor RskA
MINCNEVRDILDAYAIGALGVGESAQIEVHLADCVRCWEELGKAQRTAALLALSVPIQQAPPDIERRIMAEVRREVASIRQVPKARLLQKLRIGWASAAAALATASLAALAFAGVLQAQVNDVRNENDNLESQLLTANRELGRQIETVNSLAQEQSSAIAVFSNGSPAVEMGAMDPGESTIWYRWSADQRTGVVTCENVPPPPDGHVYQIWFASNSIRYPVDSFTPENGSCSVVVQMPSEGSDPTGVGISLEDPDAISSGPQNGWLVYAHLPN